MANVYLSISVLGLVLCMTALAACGKGGDAGGGPAGTEEGACGPLRVTVDGQPLDVKFKTGVAATFDSGGETLMMVHVFNHDPVTCEELQKGSRNVPDGEVYVRGVVGGTGAMGQGVGLDTHNQFGVSVERLGSATPAVGDTVKLCVKDASFTPMVSRYADKKVVIDGTIEGKYCGARPR